MITPKRMPKEGERIRIYVFWGDAGGGWFWADVAEMHATGFICKSSDMGEFYREPDEYGQFWRFPEDDPEVCAERPAVKGDE